MLCDYIVILKQDTILYKHEMCLAEWLLPQEMKSATQVQIKDSLHFILC